MSTTTEYWLSENVRLELEKTKAELAEARAVLADVLEDRGESWLAQLAGRRAELLEWLKCGEERTLDCGCDDAFYPPAWTKVHFRECKLGAFIRLVGGPEETQRQVDAAHEAALMEGAL